MLTAFLLHLSKSYDIDDSRQEIASFSQMLVACACNPRYSGSRDHPYKNRAGGVSQGEGP
jgi:hypothetical protein